MKKHILGLTIFSFIFVSFAVAFAFFYAPPIPKVEEIKTPVYLSEPRLSCRKTTKKPGDIAYQILSSQYYADENKVVSKIKLDWNGFENAPKQVYVSLSLMPSSVFGQKYTGTSHRIENPFAVSDSKTITIVSRAADYTNFDVTKNNYAFINISQEFDKKVFENMFNPTPVVFVYGEKSKIPLLPVAVE